MIRSLLAGKTPATANHPVCVECKMQENPCRYDYGEICLGPLTKAGCRAWCPSNGFWCFGCRGLLEDANIEAAKQVMEQYGKSTSELEAKLMLFNTKLGEQGG